MVLLAVLIALVELPETPTLGRAQPFLILGSIPAFVLFPKIRLYLVRNVEEGIFLVTLFVWILWRGVSNPGSLDTSS